MAWSATGPITNLVTLIEPCYDARGEMVTTENIIRTTAGQATLRSDRAYNDAGQVKSITHPDGEAVTYDDDGSTGMIDMDSQLVGGCSTPLVVSDQAMPWGAPAKTILGTTPNTTTNYTYGTVVIVDPSNPDGGTVFKPDGGRRYFDEQFN